MKSSRDKDRSRDKDEERVHSTKTSRPTFFRRKDGVHMIRVNNVSRGVHMKTFHDGPRVGALWDSGAMSCVRPDQADDKHKNLTKSGVTGVGGYSLDAKRTQQGEIVMKDDKNTPEDIKQICSGSAAVKSGTSHIWIGDECLLAADMTEQDKAKLVRQFKRAAEANGGRLIKMRLYEDSLPIIEESDYDYLREKMRLDDPTYHEGVMN